MKKTSSFKTIILCVSSLLILAIAGIWSYQIYQEKNRKLKLEKYSATDQQRLRKNYHTSLLIIQNLNLIKEKIGNKVIRSTKVTQDNYRPHHVWHKARTDFVRMQILKEINGLSPSHPPQFLTGQASTLDVYKLLVEMHKDSLALMEHLKIKNPSSKSKLPKVILPGDVYNNLKIIGAEISSLTSYVVKPEQVYQLAQLIVNNLTQIQSKVDGSDLDIQLKTLKGQNPREVYNHTFKLLYQLDKLSNLPKFSESSALSIPNKRGGHIVPSDVMELLSVTLANVELLKFSLRINQEPDEARFVRGKTPSDVFLKLTEAIEITNQLMKEDRFEPAKSR